MMEQALVLLTIIAATLLIGWLVRRMERKNQRQLDQTQIDNLNKTVESMKKTKLNQIVEQEFDKMFKEKQK